MPEEDPGYYEISRAVMKPPATKPDSVSRVLRNFDENLEIGRFMDSVFGITLIEGWQIFFLFSTLSACGAALILSISSISLYIYRLSKIKSQSNNLGYPATWLGLSPSKPELRCKPCIMPFAPNSQIGLLCTQQ
jgi:hypothetical protein